MAEVTKATDQEYEDHLIESVKRGKGGWEISHSDHLIFWIPEEHGVKPRKGQTARFYGRGFGSVVRGVDINGVEVYYRTPDEQAKKDQEWSENWHREKLEKFEATGRAELDAQYAALPLVFQQRLDRFRRNNPFFRWEHEAYEMSCCVDAVKIADVCPTFEDVKAFHALPWEHQKERVPDLSDGHSGNSFGMACRLASLYVDNPRMVPLEHDALCGLVGCNEYGCAPLPTPEEFEAAKQ